MEYQFPRRKPIRLRNYDYSRCGCYFITICIRDRNSCLGHIENNVVIPSSIGTIVDQCIMQIAQIHPGVIIPCKIVMPDHVHFIIKIIDNTSVGAAYHAARDEDNQSSMDGNRSVGAAYLAARDEDNQSSGVGNNSVGAAYHAARDEDNQSSMDGNRSVGAAYHAARDEDNQSSGVGNNSVGAAYHAARDEDNQSSMSGNNSVGAAYHAARDEDNQSSGVGNNSVGAAYHAARDEDNQSSGVGNNSVGAVYHAARDEATPSFREKSKMIIPKIIQQFKTVTQKLSKGMNICQIGLEDMQFLQMAGLHDIQPLHWQRGYYDRIIRDEEDYRKICLYIENNPMNWRWQEHITPS